MAHPALAGVARIAPALLIGKLFRLFGADLPVFPNHGGRFGYSRRNAAGSPPTPAPRSPASATPCRCRPAA